MPIWLHAVFLRQHYHVHERPVESGRHLHIGRFSTIAAGQPVYSAAAAASHHTGRPVLDGSADGPKRSVLGDAPLWQHRGELVMLQWLHAV